MIDSLKLELSIGSWKRLKNRWNYQSFGVGFNLVGSKSTT